ncbi:MAG: 30S ribosomal protein S2 [Patescibacteria group bacterium]|nr:30S ribosomal protein S2 [Patescibacteria group bacterium]MCL5262120.1 30S ribosomal protein S2 [Patescibacteria group bacterium]
MATQMEAKENEIIEAQETKVSPEDLLTLQEMIDAGLLHGLAKSKTHPKMRPYIHSTRSGIEVIDLVQTIGLLKKAAEFLKSVVGAGKSVLFVGTTAIAKQAVKDYAEKTGNPYVTERWVGGILTNFKIVNGRVQHFKKLLADKETGNLAKYTKKEQLMIEREIAKMATVFTGLKDMGQLPGVMLVMSPSENKLAIDEAKAAGIPVVALLNTNADPTAVEYPIPGNDKLSTAINWVLNYLEPDLKHNEQRGISQEA